MTTINDSCGSCGGDLNPSDSYVWHYPDEDCRALRDPIPYVDEVIDNSDPLRCRYDDCVESHPIADDDEPVTCPTCRKYLGLPGNETTILAHDLNTWLAEND